MSARISRTTASGSGFADTRGVRQHQIALQQLELLVGDAGLREQAEAGIDAVGRIAARDDLVDQRRRRCDARAVLRAERSAAGCS